VSTNEDAPSTLPPALKRVTRPRLVLPEADRVPAWLRQTPGEHRWPAALAVLAAVALQLSLPDDLATRPRLLLPAVEALRFPVLVIGNPVRLNRERKVLRFAGVGLVAVASVATAWSAALLVQRLVVDSRVPATHLLLSGGAIWLTNVIVFALWYWEMDRGGPA